MKKLKLYLDTSVISHLFAEDTPDKMLETNKLWEDFVTDKFDIYISTVTTYEIEKCPEPKRSLIIEKMREINLKLLDETDEINELANEYISSGVLTQKSFDDCLHISCAVVNNCDIIISWNFKHIVNYKTIDKVRIVNSINRYKEIMIVSPTMMIEGV